MAAVVVAGRHPVYELTAADLVVRQLDELSFVNLKQLFRNEELAALEVRLCPPVLLTIYVTYDLNVNSGEAAYTFLHHRMLIIICSRDTMRASIRHVCYACEYSCRSTSSCSVGLLTSVI